MTMMLMRFRDGAVTFPSLPRDKNSPAPHALALATESNGATSVYCQHCDTDYADATHCCRNNRGLWGEVCDECSGSEWYLDMCEEYWTSRYEGM